MEWWTISGTVASIVGLGVSIAVLCVAKGAKKAAEEARDQAGRRTLVDELRNASAKVQHISTLLKSGERTAVGLMGQEVLASCSAVLARWPDGLSESRRDGMINAKTQVQSILAEVATMVEDGPSRSGRKRITSAQLLAAEHINSALGEAQGKEERSGR